MKISEKEAQLLQLQSEVLQMKERSVATQSLLPSQALTVVPGATPTHTHVCTLQPD